MNIILIILLLLSALSITSALVAILMLKKQGNNGSNELLLSIYQEMKENSDAMKALSVEQRTFSDSAMHSLSEMNRVSREQLSAMMREERERSNKDQDRHINMIQEMNQNFDRIRESNKEALADISKKNESLSAQVKADMDRIRSENDAQLEKMRQTVDEKLTKTLDERLTQSFESVTRNLESLYKSLGEMNNLAKDVGNLNKMFMNIKSRGTWGEVQAEAILSDILTPNQYVKNYSPKGSGSFVEFAIKLPGKDEGKEIYLPIDSKFPKEDFMRYNEAIESGDEDMINTSLKNLKLRVLAEARDIRDKYIMPPRTTDFALLFVPTESLYAELLRIDGFVESLQNNYKVVLTGPTNFAALINSLQMGFKTLLVEKNTKKVWDLFAVLKHQFSQFGEELEATKKSLESAATKVDKAVKRNNTISVKLQRIELPENLEIDTKEENLLE